MATSHPKMTCLPVEFSSEKYSALCSGRIYSLRQTKVASRRLVASGRDHLEARR